MVLVTLGTQKQSFRRLLDMVENSKELQNDDIIAQIGHTKYESKRMQCFDFVDSQKLNEYIKNAEIIITHAGVGSIFDGLHNKKKVIAIPRLKKYGEHINDHQLEICEELEKEGYILSCLENENLDEKIKEIRNKELKKYETNENFLEILKKEI